MSSTSQVGSHERRPRICIATTRDFNKQVFRCGVYEAEDVLVETADVDMIRLQPGPGFVWRDWWQKRLVYRDVSEKIVLANPGLRHVALTRDYDLFVAVCQYHEDLPYINAIQGWKDRCKTSVCWLDEMWMASIQKCRHWLSMLRKFDYVFIGSSSGSVASLSELLGKSVTWLPLAVDALRFCPIADPPERAIDVFSMGRRSSGLHASLNRLAAGKAIFYLHDTYAAAEAKVFDHRQHREVLANLSQRSKYFIVAPSKLDSSVETRGQIEFGPRYYEGAAAGAVLIGQSAKNQCFPKMFDWPDAVVEIQPEGADVADVLRDLNLNPERRRAISQRNSAESLLRHDWLYRWQALFQTVGLETSIGMKERLARLQARADMVLSCSSLQGAR